MRQSYYESEINRRFHPVWDRDVRTPEQIEAERQAAAERVVLKRRARKVLREAGIEGVEVR